MRGTQHGVAARGGVAARMLAVLGLSLVAAPGAAGCGDDGAERQDRGQATAGARSNAADSAAAGDAGPTGTGTTGATGTATGEAGSSAAERALDMGVVALTARIGQELVPSTGAVLDADRGLILTTAHSLWGATSLKVTSALAVLHGRIVARSPCDDIALVETQPRLPGLVPVPREGGSGAEGASVVAVGRGAEGLLRTELRLSGEESAGGGAPAWPASRALALDGVLPKKASGAPVLDADGRLVGLATVPGGGPPALVPVRTIAARLDELKPGDGPVYAGWRRHYACTGRLDAYARSRHRGYRPVDARLNAPVAISRLAGAKVEDDG